MYDFVRAGMARCVVASRGLVHQLLSPTNEWDSRLPRSFKITERRLHRSLDDWMDEIVRLETGQGQDF